MIEYMVNLAIASLLSTGSGLKVVAGIENNDSIVTLPYCVVYSQVDRVEGNSTMYVLDTTIEFQSIISPDDATIVNVAMTEIDRLINSQPAPEVLSSLTLTGLSFIGWEGVTKTKQAPGDRCRNVRELKVYAQLSG